MKLPKLERPFQFISSLLLVVVSCILFIGVPWIQNLTSQISRVLKPEGFIYRAWQKYPPLIHKFYLFNWTNPEELYNPNVKPHFTEVGPFTFEFRAEKSNITWNNNETITFRNLRYWYFDAERSAFNLTQKITTINVFIYFAVYRMRYWSSFLQRAVDISLRTLASKMYLEKTAGELLFDGYDDPVLNLANFVTILELLKIPGYDKIGWLYQRNGSQFLEEYLNMQTSGDNFGQIRQWNFMSEMPYYANTCNEVRGSAGEFFPIHLPKKPVEIFWPESCRPFAFEFEKETTFRGFTLFKYSAENTFDNGTKIPQNRCYRTGEDSPSGTFNLSTCRYGAPVFASLPHFYGADSYYVGNVDGLRPSKEKHDAFLLLEPKTGTPLYSKVRVQANVLLQPNNYVSMFRNVRKIYMPVIWVEQEAEVPSTNHLFLKIYLNQEAIVRTIALLGILIGMLMFVSRLWKQKFTVFFEDCGKTNDKQNTGEPVSQEMRNLIQC